MRYFYLLWILICIQGIEISAGKIHNHGGDIVDARRNVYARSIFPTAKKRATFNVTFDGSDSPATITDALTRLKLLAYAEKLNAKENKMTLKAEKKAEKQKLWNAYLSTLSTVPNTNATTPFIQPLPLLPFLSNTSPLLTVPPIPMVPAIGLWKQAWFLSQLYGAMANANAAQGITAGPTSMVSSAANKIDSSLGKEDMVISNISKRHSPYHDEKPRKSDHYKNSKKYWQKNESDNNKSAEEDKEDPGSVKVNSNPSSLSGPFSKFSDPVSQAGCSGSHIHICSGTTVYLNSPENQNNDKASEKPKENQEGEFRNHKNYQSERPTEDNDNDDEAQRHSYDYPRKDNDRKESAKHHGTHRQKPSRRNHRNYGRKQWSKNYGFDKRGSDAITNGTLAEKFPHGDGEKATSTHAHRKKMPDTNMEKEHVVHPHTADNILPIM